ncbi:MAG: HD family phosphohydrolase [Dysgonomonas sp.]
MKINLKGKIKIPAIILFLVSILLITLFAPRENKFKYSYSEGKPWRYGLLTAPFDFPIYKPDKQIEAETDSLMAGYQRYYFFDKTVPKNVISSFEKDAQSHNLDAQYVDYVKNKLTEIYKKGIISIDDYDQIEKSDNKLVKIINENDNVAVSYQLSELYTSKQAYQKLISEVPQNIDANELRALDLNAYLASNILYDEGMSTKAKDELMQQISLAQGMVQSGEKIIDRGEIIGSETYNILKSLEKITEEKGASKTSHNWLILGQLMMVSLFIFSFMIYLQFFRPAEYANRKNLVFMLLMITGFCVITEIIVNYKLVNVNVIPFAISTILIRTFIDSRTAMTSHMIMIFICSLMVPFPVEFLLIQIPVGYICIFSLKDLSERSQLIRSSFLILIVYNIAYIGTVLWQEGNITQVNWRMFIYFLVNFIFVMFSYLLVYICEKVFGFISGVSMVELSNINKPVLQQLSETAPGTFQHSMQVANLASAAALKIGANASLVRTGALYHDIGKTTNPAFFTENQTPGHNPHNALSYKESAQIIIGHVKEGERLGKINNLPQQIIDFIRTHHGTGKARFFYNSYKNEHPDEEIDESAFSYPGPNPFSKETGILMMADTVEAASRSLTEYTDESISGLVNRLINMQMEEGLLKNTPLTFKDIETIKEVFCEKLKTVYHTRISYPELNKSESLA